MKSNKNYKPLAEPAYTLYLVVMAAFALASLYFRQNILAAAEGAVTLVLAIVAIVARRRKAKQLTAYIESIAYDTESAKNSTLLSFPLPMAVFRLSDSSVVWGNDAFFQMFGVTGARVDAELAAMVPDFSGNWLLEGQTRYPRLVEIKDHKYQMFGNLIRSEQDDDESAIMGITYWMDVTDYDNTRILYEQSRPVPGVIIIDNLEEMTRNYPERVKNEIRDAVEERLQRWVGYYHGILRRYDRDRYLVFVEKKDVDEMRKDKFDIIEEMHEVENPNGIPASISIGFGEEGATLEEGLQYADLGTELALSRGGDQAVIKNRLSFDFFGGRGFEIEKRTKVKSRVMANTLSELIRDSSKVYVMGHKFADLDAVGADVGICCLARKYGIRAQIVIEPNHNAARALIDRMKKDPDYKDVFMTPQEALISADARTLLVVVDTNRPEQVEDSGLLSACNRVAVIDHHRVGATYIQNAALGFIEPYASSASELVTEILQELSETSEVKKIEAEALLAGIVLDTKSFSLRTGERTFDAASWLRRCGAETSEVKKLFQIDMDTTVARYKLMQNAKLYRGVAIVVPDEVQERIVTAQAADELLNISGVEASVVTSPDGEGGVYASARSIGNMNVQILMEKLGGGGNRSAAAVKLENTTPAQAEEKIRAAIDDYLG
ncbi:MAG: DHH family phosphoesterase [Oscillospiraceae bacterium]|nr:DHH family phosphoesterase [Oscillospiraceae bacterium]